jgi:hypothetical protein
MDVTGHVNPLAALPAFSGPGNLPNASQLAGYYYATTAGQPVTIKFSQPKARKKDDGLTAKDRTVIRILKGQDKLAEAREYKQKALSRNSWTGYFGELASQGMDLARWGTDWIARSLPAVELLPGVDAASAISPDPDKETPQLGMGGLLLTEFDFGQSDPEDKGLSYKDALPSLKKLAGAEKVHVLPNSAKLQPYLRNVVGEGPNSMLTSVAYPGAEGDRLWATRDAAEQYFRDNGIRHERMKNYVNFANVEFIPKLDLLILASADTNPMSAAAEAELREKFGNPKNVIHFELNTSLLSPTGTYKCYDKDLVQATLTNDKGEYLALVHKPCINERASNGRMGREQALNTLQELGVKRIDIDKQDHNNLATNFLSLEDGQGRAVFSSRNLSVALKKTFKENGVHPVYAAGDKVIGSPIQDRGFGYHCVGSHIRLPEHVIARLKAEKKAKIVGDGIARGAEEKREL